MRRAQQRVRRAPRSWRSLPLALTSLALATLAPIVVASAQSGGARVEGVVWDSLRTLGPLSGASVVIAEHGLLARSDGKGRFAFGRVPQGRWTIAFSHPRLDSLALFEVPNAVEVPAKGTARIRLVTPGPERLYGSLCRQLTVAPAGVVIGRVTSAEEGTPVAGALVRARWREVAIENATLNERVATRDAITGDDGTFRLCDVPVDGTLDLQARTSERSSGVARFEPLERVVSLHDLAISLRDSGATLVVGRAAVAAGAPPADSAARAESLTVDTTLVPVALGAGSATLSGRVLREGDVPLEGAMVRVVGALGGARSNALGRFTLTRIPGGTQTIEVLSLGHSPESRTLTLAAGGRDSLLVTMTSVRTLERTTVYGSASVRASMLDGVMRRNASGFGRVVKGSDLAEEFSVGDALQKRLLIRMAWGPNGRIPVMRYGARECVPSVAVDGLMQRSGAELFDLLASPGDVFAVEVFPRASSVPSELQAALLLERGSDLSSCGLIAIWRR